MPHFSEHVHPDYKELHEKWEFALDHYTGKYIEPGKIHDYLPQRKQRESNSAYDVRKDDSDPIMHFATAVDGLCGIMFGAGKDTNREWGQLGDPEEEGTIAHRLWHNADGKGTNWVPLFKQVAIKQTVLHKIYGLVEGVEVQEDASGETVETLSEAKIKIINPQSVVNWYPDQRPKEVLVKEKRDVRTSVYDKPDVRDVYTLYTLDGWRRFYTEQEEINGETVTNEVVIGEGSYQYWASSRREERVLPIFSVEIPMPRFVGYLLAKKQNHIFNFKSIRDFGASNLSLAILKLAGTKEQTDAIAKQLEKGANYITLHPDAEGDHGYISPPAGHLAEVGNILEQDTVDFYINAFKEYGDAAAQRTATEVRLESKTGIEAFLTLLVSSLDEFENQCFLRLNQVYFPDRPAVWGESFVKRSNDFQPKDEEAAIEKMKNWFFGERDTVPATSDQLAEIAKVIIESRGVVVEDDNELKSAIEQDRAMVPTNGIGG